MLHSRRPRNSNPAAARKSTRSADRTDIVTGVMLAAGTVAIAASVDVLGLLARWTAEPWGWLLNQLWALLVVMAITCGVIAARRRRQIKAAIWRWQQSERRLADFAAATSQWLWELDAEQRLVMVSDQAPAVLVELARARAPWRPGGPLLDDEGWVRHRAELVRGRPVQEFRCRLREADGTERHLQISASPVQDASGQLQGYRGTIADVTSTTVAEEQAQHMAAHDGLTGLANRAGLVERLEQALTCARSGGTSAALLCLNLDRFSELNDTLGHALGDRVLQACADRLQESLGRASTKRVPLGTWS
jgi:PAS domain-containing protein